MTLCGYIKYNYCGGKKRGEEMQPNKMGRPPAENPKDKTLRIRVDTSTLEKLDQCSQELDTNRSEIVRKGIDMVHESLKK